VHLAPLYAAASVAAAAAAAAAGTLNPDLSHGITYADTYA